MTGQWADPIDFRLAGARHHVVVADGEEWDVLVCVPSGTFAAPLAGEGPYPVLYVVDALATFPTAASIAHTTLALSAGALTPIAVVGIGPRTDDLGRVLQQRNRDLTPTESVPPTLEGQTPYGTGGADRFLTLLTDEIAPAIEERYALDRDDRCIAGWSLGGLFACHALLKRPDFFRRGLAVSPSLYWDNRVLIKRAKAVGEGALAGRSLYIGTGEHESSPARLWPALPPEVIEKIGPIDMVGDAEEFARSLAKRSGLVVRQEVIADEHHTTVWAAAFTRGLTRLYGNPPP